MACQLMLRLRRSRSGVARALLASFAFACAMSVDANEIDRTDSTLAEFRANVDRTLSNPSLSQAAKESALWQQLDAASKSELASRYIIEAIELGGPLNDYERAFSELQQSHGSSQKVASLLRLLGRNYIFPRDSSGLDPKVMKINDRILQVLRQGMTDVDPLVARTAVMSFARIGPIEESRAAVQDAGRRRLIDAFSTVRELLTTLPVESAPSGTHDRQVETVEDIIALANASRDASLRSQTAGLIAINFQTEASVAGIHPKARQRLLAFEEANGPQLNVSTSEFGIGQAVAIGTWLTARATLNGVADQDLPSYLLETALSSNSTDAAALALVMSPAWGEPILDRARATNQLGTLRARLQSAKDRTVEGSAARSTFDDGIAVITRHHQ